MLFDKILVLVVVVVVTSWILTKVLGTVRDRVQGDLGDSKRWFLTHENTIAATPGDSAPEVGAMVSCVESQLNTGAGNKTQGPNKSNIAKFIGCILKLQTKGGNNSEGGFARTHDFLSVCVCLALCQSLCLSLSLSLFVSVCECEYL